jgi:hypothetical protein
MWAITIQSTIIQKKHGQTISKHCMGYGIEIEQEEHIIEEQEAEEEEI